MASARQLGLGAADLLDAEGVQSLRSLHQICVRTLQHRLEGEHAQA